MSKCSYCGRENDEAVAACSECGRPLESEDSQAAQSKQVPSVACPGCGARDNYAPAVELRSSFNLGTFLLGGLLAVIFRNAGRPRRFRCVKCDTLFSVRTPASKASLLVFWVLVAPGIFLFGLMLYAAIHALLNSS